MFWLNFAYDSEQCGIRDVSLIEVRLVSMKGKLDGSFEISKTAT